MKRHPYKKRPLTNLVGTTNGTWTIISDSMTRDRTGTVTAVDAAGNMKTFNRYKWKQSIKGSKIINHRKVCKWEVHDNYVVGRTTNDGLVFYLDYKDYLKVKDLPLSSHRCKKSRPYICYRYFDTEKVTTKNKALISLLGLPYWTRFINGNHCDFRSNNIDTTGKESCNIMNRLPGIYFNTSNKTWRASINTSYAEGAEDKQPTHLAESKDLGDCIKARLKAEATYFNKYGGKYEWRNKLYEAWGI